MEETQSTSPRTVLAHLGVEATRVHTLGGTANRHWLIGCDSERFVLRRYAEGRSLLSVLYEIEVMRHVAQRGWPVPEAVVSPLIAGRRVWYLFSYAEGRRPSPRTDGGRRSEERKRGRLLAEIHHDLADLSGLGQRDDWLRQDEILAATPSLEDVFESWRAYIPREVSVLRLYTERTRESLSDLVAEAPPAIVIHGDFTSWNMRYKRGALSAILDWELTHLDHRVADFALSWRGIHHEVLRGYQDVSPLEPVELELLQPIRWAWLLAGARHDLLHTRNTPQLDWTLSQLTRAGTFNEQLR